MDARGAQISVRNASAITLDTVVVYEKKTKFMLTRRSTIMHKSD